MNYKDFMKDQKKYIEAKKEALLGKVERKNNPREPRVDPPPQNSQIFVPILATIIIAFLLVPLIMLLHYRTAMSEIPVKELTLWVFSTEEEYKAIKEWLEPEILANDLDWKIEKGNLSAETGYSSADLLIIEIELAKQFHGNQVLVSLWDKRDAANLENVFFPLREVKPFRKNLGWAIPYSGNIEDARHLFTVMRQFAIPFTP